MIPGQSIQQTKRAWDDFLFLILLLVGSDTIKTSIHRMPLVQRLYPLSARPFLKKIITARLAPLRSITRRGARLPSPNLGARFVGPAKRRAAVCEAQR